MSSLSKRLWAFGLFLCLLYGLSQCTENTPRNFTTELPLIEKLADTTTVDTSGVTIPQIKRQYYIVTIVTNEPYDLVKDNNGSPIRILRAKNLYVSNVESTEALIDEAFKNKAYDDFFNQMYNDDIEPLNTEYLNYAKTYNLSFEDAKVDIVSKDIYFFNTFNDAYTAKNLLINPKNSEL